MPNTRPTGRRGAGGARTAAATACTAASVSLLAVAALAPRHAPPPEPPQAARAPAEAPAEASAPRGPVLPRSVPTRVTVPRIGLTAAVEGVGTADDGSVAMPDDADRAGWYTGSVTPGERGSTILVGHLDSAAGPAVFYGLGAVRKGDRVVLQRRDGRRVAFAVTHVAVWPKSRFPSERVYGPAPHPRLTLVTCADWDPEGDTYRANLVVTAHPAGGQPQR